MMKDMKNVSWKKQEKVEDFKDIITDLCGFIVGTVCVYGFFVMMFAI